MSTIDGVRTVVRERYGAVAEGRPQGSGCCGSTSGCCEKHVVESLGYDPAQVAAIPEGANLGLGCGNPLEWADLAPGETVLDLGSGAGIDVFLASKAVGPTGRAIGVDMTAAMIDKARGHAAKGGYANTEFRLGEIEHLPVADASVDAIVSNCVVNLSPDKAQVFREAWRALKPGGRMVLSDLVLTGPLTAEQASNVDLYCGCVAGASQRDEYLALIHEAGFVDVQVRGESDYTIGQDALPEGSSAREAYALVRSLKVSARKPR